MVGQADTTRIARGFTTDCLLVFWRGLLPALRFFGADNPRRGNLHQYSLVLFRRSLRQTPTFCRILAKAACIIFHDTSMRLFQCSELQTGNSKYRSGSNQLPQWEPSQASGVCAPLGSQGRGGVMAMPQDYRRYAAECLRLAQGLRGRAEAAMLLEMVERWRRLAKAAENRGSVTKDEE
jgi:hypothetical protein